MLMSFVSNTCVGWSLFKYYELQYTNPLIASLILDDFQYLQLCSKFHYYMSSVEPKMVSTPNANSAYALQTKSGWYKHAAIEISYPIMLLNEIEIHWIHETDPNQILSKYQRRRERYLQLYQAHQIQLVFCLSSTELFLQHTVEDQKFFIDQFLTLQSETHDQCAIVLSHEIKFDDNDDNANVVSIPATKNQIELRNHFVKIIDTKK
jgi:hypothetical protein